MKYIYYPEFELESRGLLGKNNHPNHILNIRLLLFLCDHVILPPSHLLYTDIKNIISLKNNLQEFFDEGKIVTIQYQSGIDGYLDSRIERIQDPIKKEKLKLNADLINTDLFSKSTVEHNKVDEKKQLALFDTWTRELLDDSNAYKKQSRILIECMDKISYKSGEPVHSHQLNDALIEMYNNKTITRNQKIYLLNLMSQAYYLSGTQTMDSLVSYNNYFEQIDLQGSLLKTYSEAANLIINPYFLYNLFSTMGITVTDICQLSVDDYNKIMDHKYWKSFLAIFETIYTDAQDLNDLLKYRESLKETYQKRKHYTSDFEDWFSNAFMGAILLGINPILGWVISIVCDGLRKFVPPLKRLDNSLKYNFCEKFLFLMNRSQDPLLEFCYRLNSVIEKLK